MGRKRTISIRARLLGLAGLLALLALGWGWWQFIHWAPPREQWPVQGVLIGMEAGPDMSNFVSLRAVGADFAYLAASQGGTGRSPHFSAHLAAARAAKVKVGAVHAYDPCLGADSQAAGFVTTVPRDPELLPPAIELEVLADACPRKVSDAEVESELTTFLNQIEGHAGKPAILKLGADFEARYHLAGRIERDLWLSRDLLQPDYAGRPWALWTANSALRSDGAPMPLAWVVARP